MAKAYPSFGSSIVVHSLNVKMFPDALADQCLFALISKKEVSCFLLGGGGNGRPVSF